MTPYVPHGLENKKKKIGSQMSYSTCDTHSAGTVNAPVLFNLYILDLIKNTKNIIAFADDIVIYHADKSIYNINVS